MGWAPAGARRRAGAVAGAGAGAGRGAEYAALSVPARLLQPAQLAASIWLLLLLPAGLLSVPRCACGGSILGLLPFEYLAFFCAGTLPRVYRFGRFVRPKVASKEAGARVRDFLLFQVAIFSTHWLAVGRFLSGAGWEPLLSPPARAALAAARLLAIALTAAAVIIHYMTYNT